MTSFQVGGYKPSTVVDFEVPKRYGLRQTIADTLGIGGIMRGLRTIPVLLDVCRDLEEVSARRAAAQLRQPDGDAVLGGRRGQPDPAPSASATRVQGTTKELADDLGLPADEIDQLAAGINHMAFFLRFEHQGEDLYPALRERRPARLEPRPLRGCSSTSATSSPSPPSTSRSTSPWFIKDGRDDLIERFNVPLDEYPRRCERQIGEWQQLRADLEGGGS